MRSQKIDAGGDEKQGILFTWPKGALLERQNLENEVGLPANTVSLAGRSLQLYSLNGISAAIASSRALVFLVGFLYT